MWVGDVGCCVIPIKEVEPGRGRTCAVGILWITYEGILAIKAGGTAGPDGSRYYLHRP